MKLTRTSHFLLITLAAVATLALWGCGDNDQHKETKEPEKPKPRLQRIVTQQIRMQQLNETVEVLEQDIEMQRQHLLLMRSQVAVLQEDLARMQEAMLKPGETTASLMASYSGRPERTERDEEPKTADEDAGNGVLSTLLVLAGAALVIIYFARIYRDRDRKPEDQAAENRQTEFDYTQSGGGIEVQPRRRPDETPSGMEPPVPPGTVREPVDPGTQDDNQPTA